MVSYLILTHSHWRHVVLALLILAALRLLVGWLGKQSWHKFDSYLVRVTAGSVHLQALMGIILYILRQSWGTQGITLWHAVPGLISVALVAKASGWAKRGETANDKFKWSFIGIASALLVVSFSVLYITSR